MHELWIGPAGSGKTQTLIDFFLSLSETEQQKTLWILPNFDDVHLLSRRILTQSGKKAFLLPIILPFKNAIENWVGAGRGDLPQSLRYFLIEESIKESQSRLQVWKDCIQIPSFTERISHWIDSFEKNEILFSVSEALALDWIENQQGVLLREKLSDLYAIGRVFMSKLKQQGFLTQNQLYQNWDRELRHTAKKPYQRVLIDGFSDLDMIQKKWIRSLETKQPIIFCLSAETGGKRSAVFEKPMRLLDFFKTYQVKEFKSAAVPSHASALHGFAENWPKGDGNPKPEDESLEILLSYRKGQEWSSIAQRIIKLKTDQPDLKYRDIAVLVNQLHYKIESIQRVWDHYHLPFHIHERLWMKDLPCVKVWLQILEWISPSEKIGGIQAGDPIEEILNSERWGVSPEWNAFLKRYNEKHSQYGFDLSKAIWDETLFEHPLFPMSAQKIYAEWKRRWIPLQQLKKEMLGLTNAAEISQRLTSFFVNVLPHGLDEKWILVEWQKMLDDFESSVLPHWNLPQHLQYLRRGIEAHLVSLPETPEDAVAVHSVSLARNKTWKVVIIAELNEKIFPKVYLQDPLFSDLEKKDLGLENETAFSKQKAEKYLFYQSITRATEKLILSYSRFNDKGAELLPSFYLDTLLKQKNPQVHYMQNPYGFINQTPFYPDQLMRSVLDFRRGRTISPDALFLPEWRKLKEKIIEPETQTESLIKSSLLPAYRSGTQLETVAQCGFAYFSKYHLRLRPIRWDSILQPTFLGSLLHAVLESFYKSAEVQKLNEEQLSFSEVSVFLEQEFKRVFEDPRVLGESVSFKNRLMLNRLLKDVMQSVESDWEQIQRTQFYPKHMEWSFKIPYRSGDSIQGRFDRLDQNLEQKWKIMDYKKGSELNRKKMRAGLSLQLPLYFYAAVQSWGKENVIQASILNLKKAKISGLIPQKVLKQAESLEEYKNQFLLSLEAWLDLLMKKIRDQDIHIKPASAELCLNCDYGSLCRIEPRQAVYRAFENNEEPLCV